MWLLDRIVRSYLITYRCQKIVSECHRSLQQQEVERWTTGQVSYPRYGYKQSDISSSCVPKIHENGVPFLCHTKTSDKYVAVKMTVSRDNNWWHKIIWPNELRICNSIIRNFEEKALLKVIRQAARYLYAPTRWYLCKGYTVRRKMIYAFLLKSPLLIWRWHAEVTTTSNYG